MRKLEHKLRHRATIRWSKVAQVAQNSCSTTTPYGVEGGVERSISRKVEWSRMLAHEPASGLAVEGYPDFGLSDDGRLSVAFQKLQPPES